MSSTDDPLTQVYDELWTLLTESKDFNRRVKQGNTVDFNQTNRDLVKENVNQADLPEVSLQIVGLTGNLVQSSSGSMLLATFSWGLASGDIRYNRALFPVIWEIYRAMAGWQSRITRLEYRQENFVKRVNVLDALFGLTDEVNRGIKGWSGLWNCEVEMHFTTTTIIPS